MMKKTKNKHGFTMVELLATIAIIAVLTTLAIVGVNGVRNALKNSYYNRAEKLVVAAGMDYFNDHKNERPFRVGQSAQVALSTLESQNYIEEVKDYKKESCYENESYVLITKKSEKKYEYDTYLTCPDKNDTEPSGGSTTPDVGPGETTCSNMLTTNATGSGWSNTSVNITATKPSNIASYEIQKQSGNGWITIGSTYSTNKTITISENGIGVYHAVGRGSDGSYCTSSTVQVKIDKDKPTCGTVTGGSTTWTNSARTITQPCTDTGGSGCVKDSYEQTFSNTKLGTITIADNAGNTNSCSVNVYSDGAAPTCGTVSGASTTWLKGSRTITQACNDTGGSDCVKSSYQQTFSNTKVGTITIADNAGNTKDCSVNAYADTTAPTCGTISGASTSYTYGSRTITVACSDSGSGCASSSYSKTFNPNTSANQTTANIAIADKVGNSRNCSVNVYIYKCAAPSVSGSVASSKKCPYNGETLTNAKTVTFTVGGCRYNMTSSNSYICYYNTSSTTSSGWSSNDKRHAKIIEIGCGKVKCGYHSSNWHGSCISSSNHGAFTGSGTKWSLNRSTECTYIKAVSSGGTKEMTCNMSSGTCKSTVATMISNC